MSKWKQRIRANYFSPRPWCNVHGRSRQNAPPVWKVHLQKFGFARFRKWGQMENSWPNHKINESQNKRTQRISKVAHSSKQWAKFGVGKMLVRSIRTAGHGVTTLPCCRLWLLLCHKRSGTASVEKRKKLKDRITPQVNFFQYWASKVVAGTGKEGKTKEVVKDCVRKYVKR